MKFTDILTSSAHAYIVEAGAGEARNNFIQKFIKGLNCECSEPGARPCNSCASCRQIEAGTSMDVVHMDRSGKTAYKVEDAAALIDRLGMGSYGRHIIGVIDDADILSESIQNKLLKTLEEPEEGVVIILATANRDNLLSTVRSRCNIIRMRDYVDDVDEERPVEDENLTEVAKLFIDEAARMSGDRRIKKAAFYEVRAAVDKKVKTQEDAIALLGTIEDACREMMLGMTDEYERINSGAVAGIIDRIETARMDIYRGMQYGKALRRLYLELA